MCSEHIGEAADLAPAHGVGLAGEREWAHAGPANPAAGQMAVDNGVDLVRPKRSLIDALAPGRDGFGLRQPERGECLDALSRQVCECRDRFKVGRKQASSLQRLFIAFVLPAI